MKKTVFILFIIYSVVSVSYIHAKETNKDSIRFITPIAQAKEEIIVKENLKAKEEAKDKPVPNSEGHVSDSRQIGMVRIGMVRTETGVASWYGFESCTNPRCLQANTKPLIEGDDGMACSSTFRLGERVRIFYLDNELILTCTDRGGFEELGRKFDLHKWSFEKLAPLSRGLIHVEYERL